MFVGNQGKAWQQADIPLTYQSSQVYLEFEAIVKHDLNLAMVRGDIAIDDIMLTSSTACSDLQS